MKTYFSLFSCIFAFNLSSALYAADIEYPDSPNNVSYDDVLALSYREADETLFYGEDEFQFGRLWLPSNQSKPANLVIFIHGGCWLNSFDMEHTYALSTALSQSNLAVWSLEYRRTGDTGGGWPGSFHDILLGIAAIQDLNKEQVNTENFVIAGHSAGGHLALLAGNATEDATAVIGLASISNINSYGLGNSSCESATSRFMGAGVENNPALYASANPPQTGIHPTSILLHGDADSIVDVSQAELEGAQSIIVENAGHFDWVHPGTVAVETMIKVIQDQF